MNRDYSELQIKEKEAARLLAHIRDNDYVIALAIDGKSFDSVSFSQHLEQLAVSGKSNLVFVIGGSLGLHASILGKCNERLSFSAMTFPHQLMRVILCEQIYRSFRICKLCRCLCCEIPSRTVINNSRRFFGSTSTTVGDVDTVVSDTAFRHIPFFCYFSN